MTSSISLDPAYTGRFAPSPTGELHFGSLVAALASYLQASRHRGEWLIRIDDIDPPREVKGSAERIVGDLARFGMVPAHEVDYQSTRTAAYRAAVHRLLEENKAFPCGCSRADLPPDGAYPGTCSNGLPRGKQARSIRVRTGSEPVEFHDAIQGEQRCSLAQDQGDFVIWRADDLPSYQLATAIDDAAPGITEVVRGADLLSSTFRQVLLQHLLGLGTPAYAHVPVVTHRGEKLSKRLGSDPVVRQDEVEALGSALRFLGHSPPRLPELGSLWTWALSNWDLSRVPAVRNRDWPPNGGEQY